MDRPENPVNQSQPQSPSADAALPQEQPVILNQLFADSQKDLDALFPDPSLKKLLKESLEIRKRNDRFLKRLDFGKKNSEDDEEEAG